MDTKKKKLAVLGGGVGSMTAVWQLTSQPNWQDMYESITVYQKGWRLGGKCASGRGPNGRIEEHGLHIWLGFYDNAFDIMQKAYPLLNRPAGSPLATWEDALKRHSFLVIAQHFNDQWYPWTFNFPTDDKVPGAGAITPSLWDYVVLMTDFLYRHLKDSNMNHHFDAKADADQHESLFARLKHIIKDAMMDIALTELGLAESILVVLTTHVGNLPKDPAAHSKNDHDLILKLLNDLKLWILRVLEKKMKTDIEVYRFVVVMDLAITALFGMITDGVLFHPDKLDSLDKEDLREWLTRHGALPESANSGPVRGLYDLVFGYENGEIAKPNFAAGTALRCVLRIYFTYKGAISWKMQAGMGDTVFTPLYLALKDRGVKFEFFSRVENLGLSQDKKTIDTIRIGKQATLKGASYDPLVNIKDLECWPSDPNYEQLVEGEQLKAQAVNLESFYTQWQDVGTTDLKAGVDFDEVIYGMSLASIQFICPELLAADPKWQAMVDNVLTTRTMAFQTWLNKDLDELGWNHASPVMDAYIEPMDTWADMTQLSIRENYPPAANVQNVSYFCGPMQGGIPPRSEVDTPEKTMAIVKQISHDWLEANSKLWWPKNIDPATGGFDWTSVVDIFHRVNIDPSERYVLSVKGSRPYRLVGYESGFANLYLAGDWTVNGLNAGCVEAATMSGKIIGNVLTGNPPLKDVWGYSDL